MINTLKYFILIGIFSLSLIVSVSANQSNMLMARLPVKADIAMSYVKDSIHEHEYSTVHVQKCDNGMNNRGYKTDTYRVLFFAKGKEVRLLSEKYPDIVAFLPLKLTVVAEKDETLLSIVNPTFLSPYYKDQEVQIILQRWQNDIRSIFNDVRIQSQQKH